MEIILHTKPSQDLIPQFQSHWASSQLIRSGQIINLMEFPVLVAVDPIPVGFLSYRYTDKRIEILSLISESSRKDVGSKLLNEIESIARKRQCDTISLTTTNDNVNALSFYQKLGYRIKAVYPDAINLSRLVKPEIPLANDGIPISDEFLLMKRLKPGTDFFYREEVFHVKPSITLRPFQTITLNDLIRLFSDPKVFRYQAMHPIKTIDDASQYYHRVNLQILQEKRLVRGIYVDGQFAGIISLHHIQNDRCALGYSLSPEYWKRGIATDAAVTMIKIAIERLQIRRIEAITHPDNIASIRLLERLRFHPEGTLIEYIKNPRSNNYENRERHALLAKNFR